MRCVCVCCVCAVCALCVSLFALRISIIVCGILSKVFHKRFPGKAEKGNTKEKSLGNKIKSTLKKKNTLNRY